MGRREASPLWGSRAGMARRHVCGMLQLILVFIRRDTGRYRSKGYNGSNSHPKAGLSWPILSLYISLALSRQGVGSSIESPSLSLALSKTPPAGDPFARSKTLPHPNSSGRLSLSVSLSHTHTLPPNPYPLPAGGHHMRPFVGAFQDRSWSH